MSPNTLEDLGGSKKQYEVKAAKHRQGKRNDLNIPVNLPECKGDARDKAAKQS